MKRFGVLLLLVTVLAATGPFFIKDRNGQPLMSIRDISIPAPRLPAFSDVTQRDRTGEAAAPALYKWRDENGQWHYGRHAPAGIRAITVETPISVTAIPASPGTPPSTEPQGRTSALPGLDQAGRLMSDSRRLNRQAAKREQARRELLGLQ